MREANPPQAARRGVVETRGDDALAHLHPGTDRRAWSTGQQELRESNALLYAKSGMAG